MDQTLIRPKIWFHLVFLSQFPLFPVSRNTYGKKKSRTGTYKKAKRSEERAQKLKRPKGSDPLRNSQDLESLQKKNPGEGFHAFLRGGREREREKKSVMGGGWAWKMQERMGSEAGVKARWTLLGEMTAESRNLSESVLKWTLFPRLSTKQPDRGRHYLLHLHSTNQTAAISCKEPLMNPPTQLKCSIQLEEHNEWLKQSRLSARFRVLDETPPQVSL